MSTNIDAIIQQIAPKITYICFCKFEFAFANICNFGKYLGTYQGFNDKIFFATDCLCSSISIRYRIIFESTKISLIVIGFIPVKLEISMGNPAIFAISFIDFLQRSP